MYLLSNTLPDLSFSGSFYISIAPSILLSLCGNSLIGWPEVGLNSTPLLLLIVKSPTYTSSYSLGFTSNRPNHSVRSVTGNILTPVFTIASAGVIGTSAIVLITVLGSVELYLTLYLFINISISACTTSDTPSLL